LHYADFRTQSFSTFIYFAATVLPLPVELSYFTAEKQGDEALLGVPLPSLTMTFSMS